MTREEWAELTPKEQGVKVAECCGWECPEYLPVSEGIWPEKRSDCGDLQGIGSLGYSYALPDYLNDLNAMHEAEKLIPEHLHDHWLFQLDCTGARGARLLVTATAAQRAEAFVLTMADREVEGI